MSIMLNELDPTMSNGEESSDDIFEDTENELLENMSTYRKKFVEAQILDEELSFGRKSEMLDDHDFSYLMDMTTGDTKSLNNETLSEMSEAIQKIREWKSRESYDENIYKTVRETIDDQEMEIMSRRSEYFDTYNETLSLASKETLKMAEMKISSLENVIKSNKLSPALENISYSKPEYEDINDIQLKLKAARLKTIEDAAKSEALYLRQALEDKLLTEESEFEKNSLLLESRLNDFNNALESILARDEAIDATPRVT